MPIIRMYADDTNVSWCYNCMLMIRNLAD